MRRGGVFPYAATETAPGHATLHTGAAPRVHGITSNEYWRADLGRVLAVIDDHRSAVFGRPDGFAGPAALRVDTVADALKKATAGRARVFSVSHKDRAAILSGGQRPDVVLWYDKTIPGYTTSSYYAKQPPSWFVDWERAHPVSGAYATWEPLDAKRLHKYRS